VGDGRRRRGKKRRASKIRGRGHHQQGTCGFAAGLACRGNVSFDQNRGQQHDPEQRAADHPAIGMLVMGTVPGLQLIVQSKIADRLNNSGEHEAKERISAVRSWVPRKRTKAFAA